MTEPVIDPFARQLELFRERFANRRTVPWEMFRAAEDLVRGSAEYHRIQLDVSREEHQAEITRLREEHEKRMDVLRSTLEAQRSTNNLLEQQAQERRSLYEARRSTGPEGAEVTIRRDDYLKSWRLQDLEEIAFRLRCGGATDDTAVDMASNRAVAVVPAPNMVTLEHRPAPPERRAPLTIPSAPRPEPAGTLRLRHMLAAASLLLTALVTLMVVLL
ncbi:hypothetical protein [Nocardioides jensenii]|uniref:hypothetical protein n=1 Tax=Nocardioides jensenii TaxID=1843 RepID=UPI0008366AB0|nr:hypothetical protein [Nocardioides jensenii]